jgi:hypothetical protein
MLRATIGLLALLALTEAYQLSGVKRLDQDLYKTSKGLYIETKICYHYTYGEDAILKWNGRYSGSNSIIWADNTTCEVDNIYTR